jgi:hypothetical protein
MNAQANDNKLFETLAQVLIRCFLAGAILLMIWFIAFVAFGDSMYALHTKWFSISRTQFEVVNYSAMAATKISIVVLFLIPYVCLRLVLARNARANQG